VLVTMDDAVKLFELEIVTTVIAAWLVVASCNTAPYPTLVPVQLVELLQDTETVKV